MEGPPRPAGPRSRSQREKWPWKRLLVTTVIDSISPTPAIRSTIESSRGRPSTFSSALGKLRVYGWSRVA